MKTEDQLTHFRKLCKERGLRLTLQKEAIYQTLLLDPTHPTAEDIYVQVKKNFPKTAFATVYDNLRKFKDLNLIREFNCSDTCKRYEAKMEPHHHIIDSENQRIIDVHLGEHQKIPLPDELAGKSIKEIKITYII